MFLTCRPVIQGNDRVREVIKKNYDKRTNREICAGKALRQIRC